MLNDSILHPRKKILILITENNINKHSIVPYIYGNQKIHLSPQNSFGAIVKKIKALQFVLPQLKMNFTLEVLNFKPSKYLNNLTDLLPVLHYESKCYQTEQQIGCQKLLFLLKMSMIGTLSL